jgi:hypothetical protein
MACRGCGLSPPRYRLVNLDGSGPLEFGTVFKWAVVDGILARRQPHPGWRASYQPNRVTSGGPSLTLPS